MKRLWEIKHPYYCNEGNYFSNDCHGSYGSWAEFLAEEGDSDFDMNLLFRWDWREADPEGENWGNKEEVLLLFWIGQRKGLFRYTTVLVSKEDEPSVREWLAKRWTHIQILWEGISMQPDSPAITA